jgi:hypothetical protein
MTKSSKPEIKIPLPSPVIAADLQRPDYNKPDVWASESYDKPTYTQYGGQISFELWYTERFGWCIPTLGIRGISSRGRAAGVQTARTYGIAIKGEGAVSMGHGPHVKATHTVYVKKDRFDALKPLLDLMIKGQEKAGEIRDQRSSRRANTIARRRSIYDMPWDK